MDKEDFYKKYIQSEDEKMMEIIHSNAKKRKNDKYIEKDKNNQNLAVSVIFIAISFITGLIIGGLWI